MLNTDDVCRCFYLLSLTVDGVLHLSLSVLVSTTHFTLYSKCKIDVYLFLVLPFAAFVTYDFVAAVYCF